jgi:uncharacterized membrane protein
MAPKMAFATSLLAALAACSQHADSSGGSAAGKRTERSQAKWALPAEPVAENVAAAVDKTGDTSAESNSVEIAATPALPRDDLATFRARGSGPFWTVTVIGGTLVLDTPGKPSRYFSVEAADGGGTLRYTGQGIQLSATPGPCHDGKSDQPYADRVQIALADGVFKGCGNARTAKHRTDS